MKADFRLYLITDGSGREIERRVALALAAVAPGFGAVQLRAKDLSCRELFDQAVRLREITRRWGARLLINDRLDVAMAAEADGVHLPAHGLAPAMVRRLAPKIMIGVSTHSLAEARNADDGGADFVTLGPVWATPSKAGMGKPIGVDVLASAAAALAVPVFALGGIDRARAPECISRGARVACIRAVLGAAHPGEAALEMEGLWPRERDLPRDPRPSPALNHEH